MTPYKKHRRMTPYRAAWLTGRAGASASVVAAYVERKAADPLPNDYTDAGVDLTSLSTAGGAKLADIYHGTTGGFL